MLAQDFFSFTGVQYIADYEILMVQQYPYKIFKQNICYEQTQCRNSVVGPKQRLKKYKVIGICIQKIFSKDESSIQLSIGCIHNLTLYNNGMEQRSLRDEQKQTRK